MTQLLPTDLSSIIVTGGAGFIGSHLVDRLVLAGRKVFVIDDLSTGLASNVNGKAFVKYKPIQHIQFMGQPYLDQLGRVEVIFHLAADARIQPSFQHPAHTYDVNSSGTIQVLEFARKLGAKVVYAGSSSVYHDTFASPYAYSKHLGETHCTLYHRLFGVECAIARFFNVYGPRQLTAGNYATVLGIFERQWKAGEPLTVVGDGSQRRDMTHVEDVVDGLMAILNKNIWDASVFNFGSGRNYSIIEVAQMFKSPAVTFLPERRGEYPSTLADISMSQVRLGWQPKHNLEDYVKSVVDQHQAKPI